MFLSVSDNEGTKETEHSLAEKKNANYVIYCRVVGHSVGHISTPAGFI